MFIFLTRITIISWLKKCVLSVYPQCTTLWGSGREQQRENTEGLWREERRCKWKGARRKTFKHRGNKRCESEKEWVRMGDSGMQIWYINITTQKSKPAHCTLFCYRENTHLWTLTFCFAVYKSYQRWSRCGCRPVTEPIRITMWAPLLRPPLTMVALNLWVTDFMFLGWDEKVNWSTYYLIKFGCKPCTIARNKLLRVAKTIFTIANTSATVSIIF